MKKNVKVKPGKAISLSKSYNKLLLCTLIIITTIIYSSSLNNEFTNWDDPGYITLNKDVKILHDNGLTSTLKTTFSSYAMGNYHPLTMLTYCIDYEEFQLDPYGYHLINLILHLVNCSLVFCFIWLLTRQQWVAFITALLFAIHPMHVESVAWIAERKDVLYSFFYTAALCTYILYLKEEKWKWYFYVSTFILFVLALLSKAVAASLPITFVAVDFFLGRKITFRNSLEKTPFVLLSLIFGYIAIKAQNSAGAITNLPSHTFFARGLFVCYAVMMYLWKLIVPVSLSCLYDYPEKQFSSLFPGLRMYPFVFYLAPFVILAIALVIYKLKKFRKEVLFGTAFFLITIALVLQILPVGNAIMADRYSYLPYIGLFFIIARGLIDLWENNSGKFQDPIAPSKVALILFLLGCGYLTAQRCKIWHDSLTLWGGAINFDPNCAFAYNNLGNAYSALGKNEEAITDFTSAILINPKYPDPYYNRGNAYLVLGKYGDAITSYDSATLLKPCYVEAYSNRGLAYDHLGKDDDAVKDYTFAILAKPDFPDAYNNRGNHFRRLKKFGEAITDFDSAILINPDYAEAYDNRGISYYGLGKYNEAIKDFDSEIRINPDDAEAYKNRSVIFLTIGKYQIALDDALKAKQLGYNVDPAFIQIIRSNLKTTP